MDWAHGWDEEAHQAEIAKQRQKNRELAAAILATREKTAEKVIGLERLDDEMSEAVKKFQATETMAREIAAQAKGNPEMEARIAALRERINLALGS